MAGGDKHPFDNGALEAIFKYSKGLPRKISKIADNALISSMSFNMPNIQQIDREIIEQIANEVQLTEKFEKASKNKSDKPKNKK